MRSNRPERLPVPHPNLYRFGATVLSSLVLKHKGGLDFANEAVLDDITGPYILAPSHRSWLDIPAVAASVYRHNKTQVHFMAKDEFWQSGIKGRVLNATGAFPIDRESPVISPDTIDHIEKIVDGNAAICIFPEGGIKSGEIRRGDLKRSVAMLAMRYGLPLVPTGISGVDRGKEGIRVSFGDPIMVEQAEIDHAKPREFVRIVRPLLNELYDGLCAAQNKAENL